MTAGRIPVALLASFVPDLLIRRFAESPTPILHPESYALHGAVLLADATGFTAFAERLKALGPLGVEQLTAELNSFLGSVIEVIQRHGGDVLKLAGDAVVAVWPAESLAKLPDAVAACAQCALALQQEPRIRAGTLQLSSGIGAGDVHALIVGGLQNRWELLVGGVPFAQMARARQQAVAGEAALSPEAYALVADRVEAQPLEAGVRRIVRVVAPPPIRPKVRCELPETAADALVTYVPFSIRARLAAGQSAWISELRRVSILFINLPDWQEISTDSLRHAQTVMLALQGALHHYEGSLNKLMVDDKGVTLLAAMGLPPLAHENDPSRAVHAALNVQATLRSLRVRSAVGISTGLAFCGTVGGKTRHEYTAIGPAVNLAARLMQHAPGDILCDEATRDATMGAFRFETLPRLTVKGTTAPIAVYRPYSEALPPRTRRAAIGRERERERFVAALSRLTDGRSTAIAVAGEAGMGKSTLMGEIRAMADARGVVTLDAAADTIERSTPYHAWRQSLDAWFHLEGLVDAGARTDAVGSLLAGDEFASRLAPLLNPLLQVNFPETPLTAEMTGQVRADNLAALAAHLVRRRTADSALLLVFDDAHWFDSASWNLGLNLAKTAVPNVLVCTYRPSEMAGEYFQGLHNQSAEEMVLDPLSRHGAEALVADRLGEAALSPDVREVVIDRAQGNPFFLDELLNALKESGAIVRRERAWQLASDRTIESLALPDSVQGVITGRIDRLQPALQLTLKVASAIGRTFGFGVLHDVFPIADDRPALPVYLQELQRNDLTSPAPDQPQLAYLFKHVITRDVAYGLMLFSHRQQLHRAVAQWYEARAATQGAMWSLLAHHWRAAGEVERARECFKAAGLDAIRTGAYAEAVTFLGAALELLPDASGESRHRQLERAKILRNLAEATYAMGRLDEAKTLCERVLTLLGQPVGARGAAPVIALARELILQVFRRILRPRVTTGDAVAHDEALEASRAFEILSFVRYFGNDAIGTLQATLAALNRAERLGPSPELARTFANLGFAADLAAAHGVSAYYLRKARQTAAATGQNVAIAWVHLTYALFHTSLAEWNDARDHLCEAIRIQEELGDRRRWIEAMCLLSSVAHFQGEFRERVELARRVTALASQSGDVQARAWGWLDQIETLLPLGELREARALFELVLPLFESNLPRADVIWAKGLLARLHMDTEAMTDAAAVATEALQLMETSAATTVYTMDGYAQTAEVLLRCMEQLGDAYAKPAQRAVSHVVAFAHRFPMAEPRALRLRAMLAAERGRLAGSARLFRSAGTAASARKMPYEAALNEYEMARRLTHSGERRKALENVRHVLNSLGALRDVHLVDALLATTS